FLAIAMAGWVGIRAATLGMIPGAEIFAVKPGAVKPPLAAQPPAIEPIAPATTLPSTSQAPPYQYAAMPYPYAPYPYAPYPVAAPRPATPLVGPIQYVSRMSAPPPVQPAVWNLPEPRHQYYSPIPQGDDWQLSSIGASAMPVPPSTSQPMEGPSPPLLAQ